MERSFYYYNRALDSNYRTRCYYTYYNLAKYFYSSGYGDIVLSKDIKLMLEYYEIASNNGVLNATLELFYYYCDSYIKKRNENDKDKLLKYKEMIELHEKYKDDVKREIESKIVKITNIKSIDIDCIL